MKTVTRRRISQLCALFSGALVASALTTGCLSTTLPPFPPPAEPQTMTYTAPGQLRLTGVLNNKRSTVFAINIETGDIGGKFIRDGKYSFLVPAVPGQELELFYQVGKELSESTFFKAPPFEEAIDDGGANDGGANDGGANDGGANDGGANDTGALDAGVTNPTSITTSPGSEPELGPADEAGVE